MTPIYVALDVGDLTVAKTLAAELVDEVAGFKVGLELITGVGPSAITEIASMGRPVFADMKLHDIPNTVERAAGRIRDAGARWLTVHAAGGEEMVRAAVSGMGGSGVLGVTVLTSLDAADLISIGVPDAPEDQVTRLGRLAVSAGAEGLVCAPAEAATLRNAGIEAVLFTPGVRPRSAASDDQRRVATPEAAIAAGADYLVIGRPITAAADPKMAAREIAIALGRSA